MERGRIIICLIIIFLISGENVRGGKLKSNFYKTSCPNVETIVKQAVTAKFRQTTVTAQATLRMFFHDCFVEGCDASVMIFSPSGDAERDAPDNLSLPGDGFDTVIKAKQAVEAVCPGVISCADILAIATRDVVDLTGGPFFKVELGRRDGLISKKSHVKGRLPEPDFTFKQLKTMFAKHKLNQVDLIALSGAHTIGVSHCNRVFKRIYNFSPSSPVDPTLDPAYAQQLMGACPMNVDPTVAIPMDPVTPLGFDNAYYQDLMQGKGLFTSDEVLFSNRASRPIVKAFAGNLSEFSSAFIVAMKKLGRVGVKTGNKGEIRRDCTAFN